MGGEHDHALPLGDEREKAIMLRKLRAKGSGAQNAHGGPVDERPAESPAEKENALPAGGKRFRTEAVIQVGRATLPDQGAEGGVIRGHGVEKKVGRAPPAEPDQRVKDAMLEA